MRPARSPFAERRIFRRILVGKFQNPEETLKPVVESPVPRGRRVAFPAVLPLLVLASLVAVPVPCRAAAAIPAAQRSALVALYNATGGPHWTNRDGWLGKPGTECAWAGVTCDAGGTTVTRLFLSTNGLAGSLPPALGNLAGLQSLEAEDNALTGALPRELGRPANLRTLRLGLNQLSGAVPPELGSLALLETLSLQFNHLAGAVPAELGRLSSLQTLALAVNQLTGAVPSQLGDLRSLTYLDLSDNRLTGAIPPDLGRLAALQTLYLGGNQLSGAIPGELGSLAALEQLGLGDNLLSGRIPGDLGRLANLMFLNLQRNQLAGTVPFELGNATSLIGVLLSENRLGGNIPGAFGNLPDLQTLWLDHNRFTGPVPFELGGIPTLDAAAGLDLRANALATDAEPGLLADLNLKQAGGDWTSSQAAAAPFDPSVPLSGLADRRTGKFVLWTLDVGAGAPPLTLSTSLGTGDVDLYVRFGAPPTTGQFNASSATAGNTESVTIAAPRQGTWYIGLYSRAPYRGVTLRTGGPAGCFPSGTSLCLAGGRFKVEAAWRTADGRTGSGQAVKLTGDTGYFWFFDASNVEAVVKVLDACSFNQRFWVYAGGLTDIQVDLTVTDTVSGAVRTWRNPQGTAFQPIQDSAAFATCGATGASTAPEGEIASERIAEAAGTCVSGPTSLCLAGSRFKVDVTWKTANGQTGTGQAVPLTADTGYFWFFGATNVEMVIKVLNACTFNNKFWVYAGGLTDVETTIMVTDTMTGAVKTYKNPQGTAFRPIQDSSAFGTCP
ncbi:MAG: receptor-like serine/threonine-protein kinase [Acidobacteriota bacterium]|jgi:Leucine-rich repeat (LRR) protein|nr:receptor-like serine/threonine-protein kinase [Acidobacteriota bacterium]